MSNSSAFKLGLEVLTNQNKPKPVVRKKNPLAHVYRVEEGKLRFKAIVHEDVEGIVATRRSFKAVVTIEPTEEPTKAGSWLIWVPWVFSTIILIVTNTLYVKNLVVIACSCVLQLVAMCISLKRSLTGSIYGNNTRAIYKSDGD